MAGIFSIALASAILGPSYSPKTDDTFEFSRIYKVGASLRYTLAIDWAHDSKPFSAHLTIAVKSLTPTGAALDLSVSTDVPALKAAGPQSISTKVGPAGFPDAGSLNDAGQPFIFLSIAGATTGGKVRVGDALKVYWQNDKKDTTVDETGKILSSDKDAKTLTVDWSAEMKVSNAEGAHFHFKSVYSTEDFSLVSAEGTMTIQNSDIPMKFVRKPTET